MLKRSAILLPLLLCSCLFESADQAFDKGIKLAKEGKVKQAFKSFKYAAKKAPDSARYHFAAAQTAPDQNSAFMYTKYSWEHGLRNRGVFLSLLKLSLHVDKAKKLEYALSLFGELPDSVATPLFKGELYLEFGRPDSAYLVWNAEFQQTENSALCPKVAQALLGLGKADHAVRFLVDCKKKGILDSEGYSHLAALLAMLYNYREVDRLFEELSMSNNFNDQLRIENATYLVFSDRFKEAEPLIDRPAGPGTAGARALINLRLRTLKLYSALMQGSRSAADSIYDAVPSDTIMKKEINQLFEALKILGKKDTGFYEALRKARDQLPPDPVTTVICARAALSRKMFKEAAALYGKLPGIVLWSPRIVAERAQAMALAGNDDDALKIISFMHKQRVFTRHSLELFRNLTLKKDLVEKSEAAQKLLEEHYDNDVSLKWKGLLLAIKTEKIDSALSIARQLSTQYPEDERFVTTKLTLLLMKEEYRQVLAEIQNSSIPSVKLKSIEAAAWKGVGDTAQAIQAYEQAIGVRREPLLLMQLAEMYFQKKAYEKATGLYTELLGDTTETRLKDSLQVAILLNNNAWTMMTAGNQDLTAALAMARKAYELVPQNLHIIDTYASILYQAGKYKESIELLEKSTLVPRQKRLLCHLSRSLEKRGEINKAKRYLEDALLLKEGDQKLSPLMSDSQIREEIRRLSEIK